MDKLVKKNKILNQSLLYSGLSLSVLITPSMGLYAYAGTLPYPKPRTQIQGSYVSGDNNFMGDIDSLLPVYGNSKGFLFADVAGRYGSHDYWFASPGGGFRGIYHNQLFGVYGFGDYQKTYRDTRFWVFNPGLEWMSPTLDAHVNGYVPSRTQKKIAPTVFDSDLGNYSHVRFQGHTQYDLGTTPFLAISRGVDAELGYSIDLQGYRARVYGGGYYYHSPLNEANDIRGTFAGVQLPLNKFADVLITDSYNNMDHNRVALTLRLTWDGERKFSHNVEDRLLDRIERHSGIIQTAASSLTQKVQHRSEEIYRNNIWFFEPPTSPVSLVPSARQVGQEAAKTFSSCTYEHPCNDFNQPAVTQINQLSLGANFYMKPGNYTLANNSALTVYGNQSIYGRSSDYIKPALGTERPVFTGAILAHGSNNFDSLQVSNNNFVTFNQLYFEHGIVALVIAEDADSQRVWINNSDFSVDTDTGSSTSAGYSSAVVAAGGKVALNNSTLISQNSGTNMDNSVAYGLLLLNNTQVTGAKNNISSTSAGRYAYGVAAFNSSKLYLNHSTINAEVTGAGDAHAVHLRDFSQTNMRAVQLHADSAGTFAVGATTNQESTLNLSNSYIWANMTGSGTARAVYLRELSTTKINNSAISASSSGVNAYAVFTDQESVLNLNHSILKASTGFGGEAVGLGLQSKTRVNGSQNSIQVDSAGYTAYGVIAKNESTLALKNSTILANATGSGVAQGLQLANYAQASLNNTDITANASDDIVYGALLFDASKLQINNSAIVANMNGGSEAQTIQITDKAQAKISNSTVTANSTGAVSIAIRARKSGSLTLDNTTVVANSGDTGTSRGIQLENRTVAAVNQSTITANSSGTLTFGALVVNASKLTLNNSAIVSHMTGQQGEAQGIQIAGTSQATLTKSNVTAINLNNAVYGALVLENGILNVNQSKFLAQNTNTTQGQAYGLYNSTSGTINVTNSTLNVSGFTSLLTNGPNITFMGTNTCTLNGSQVTCN